MSEAPLLNGDDRKRSGTSDMRVGPFVEKISKWLVVIAAFGGFIVLLDPSLQGKVLGFDWKIGVGEFSPELKGAVINTMLLGGFSGVIAFWLGATKSQERTTDSLSRIAEAMPPAPNGPVVTPAPPNPETGNVPAAEVQPTERKDT